MVQRAISVLLASLVTVAAQSLPGLAFEVVSIKRVTGLCGQIDTGWSRILSLDNRRRSTSCWHEATEGSVRI
jgi:hypothetical protein